MQNLIINGFSASTPPADIAIAATPGTELTAHATVQQKAGWRVVLLSVPRLSVNASTIIPAAAEDSPGVPVESLIAQIVNGLMALQKGPTKSRAQALAITKLEEACHWLKARNEEGQGNG